MVKGKHKPPSRIRYERAHPVVSVRVSKELCQELKDLSKVTGKTFADFLKEGAGITKKQIDKVTIRPQCLLCCEHHSELDCFVVCKACYKIWGDTILDDLLDMMDAYFELDK